MLSAKRVIAQGYKNSQRNATHTLLVLRVSLVKKWRDPLLVRCQFM